MHDPNTVAFDIKYPWRRKSPGSLGGSYRPTFITIWHVDPQTDGTDDSCGWFMRARHGDPKVLAAIRGDFEFNWDADYGGWFDKSGKPIFSVSGIVLGMFWTCAFHHFGKNRKRADSFLRRHMFDILHFAENPTDSAWSSIVGKYGFERREDRIQSTSAMIYGCVLRWSRPWWKHPRWHVHHWRLQIHPLQKVRRRLFDRCCYCQKPFGWNESPVSNWGGEKLWHSGCDRAFACTPVNEPTP